MDLDYPFFKEYWRKGFASLKDGFEKLELSEIIARDLPEKTGSINVMKKPEITFGKTGLRVDLKAHWQGIRREEFNEFVSAGNTVYFVWFK